MGHSNFAAVFRSGARFLERNSLYAIEVEATGTLTTAGRIYLFDPVPDDLGGHGRAPFVRHVPPGTYEIETAFAQSVAHPDAPPRIAAIRVVLGKTSATRWEPALIEGQDDPRPWGLDPSIWAQASNIALGGDAAATFWCERFADEPWAWFGADDDEEQTVAVAFFVGQGHYAAYWGFDERGEVVELCVDTTLLTRAAFRDVRFSLPLRRIDIDAANEEFLAAGVRASREGPYLLRLDGDVRRFWMGRVHSASGKEIAPFVQPHASGKQETFCQLYDCAPWGPRGAAVLWVRMVLPDEPIEPLQDGDALKG